MNMPTPRMSKRLKTFGTLLAASISLSSATLSPVDAATINYSFSGISTFLDTSSFFPVVPPPFEGTLITGKYAIDSSNQSFSNFSLTYSENTLNYQDGFLREDGSLFAIPVGGFAGDLTFLPDQNIPTIPRNAFLPLISLTQPTTTFGVSTLEFAQPISFDAGCNNDLGICSLFLFRSAVAQATVKIRNLETQKHYTPEQKAAFLKVSKQESKLADTIGAFPISIDDFRAKAGDKVSSILVDKALEKVLDKKVGVGMPDPTSVTGILGIGAGVAALIPGAQGAAAIFGGASLGFSALGTLIRFQSYDSLLRSLDPADPNFTEIAQPVVSSIPGFPFTTTDSAAQPSVDTSNALLDNLLNSVAVGYALQTSLNRADGAALVGNSFWEQQQLQTANAYSLQLGSLVGAQPKLFNDFANIYTTIPQVSDKTNTINNVLAAQNTLRTNGFSPELIQLFTVLDVDNATQDLVRQELLALDPNEIAALGDNFPNSLKDPAFFDAQTDASIALQQGVIDGNPTAVPTPALLPGLIGFGLSILRKRRARQAK